MLMGAHAARESAVTRPLGAAATASERLRIRNGDPAPDFTLEDQNGAPVQLANCHSQRAVVLAFYCNVSCVTCVVHLFKLRELLRRRRDINLLAVGSDGRERARGLLALFGSDHHGRAPVLLDDPTFAVTERYGMLDRGGQVRTVPATFVIDRRGFVRCSLVDEAHRRRPSIDVVRRALDAAEGRSQK